MSHRYDVRTKDQFAKEIKDYHIKEAEIAVRLGIAVHAKTGKWPEIKANGVDSTGALIESDQAVTCDPDYLIGDRLVEITHSKYVLNKTFHEKQNKIKKMLANGTDMVFVNGLSEKQPNCIWLSAEQWEPFIQRSMTKYGIVPMLGGGKVGFLNKNAYRFDIYWFKDLFRPLPVLISSIPNEYKELLKSVKATK